MHDLPDGFGLCGSCVSVVVISAHVHTLTDSRSVLFIHVYVGRMHAPCFGPRELDVQGPEFMYSAPLSTHKHKKKAHVYCFHINAESENSIYMSNGVPSILKVVCQD